MVIEKIEKQDINKAISKYILEINYDNQFKDEVLGYIKRRTEVINKFIETGKSIVTEPKYKLTVLRKWNSYTPVLPGDTGTFSNKGGGYFLRVHDHGIVIDPGYNFIENFIRSGFKLDDIDSVIISHAHNDHTVELESIFSLLFKRNKKKTGDQVKKIKLFVNLGTFKKFSGYFDLSKPEDNYYIEEIIILNKHQALQIHDCVEIFITDVKHHEMISRDYAVGFIFEISDIANHENKICTLKFTCDTGWSSDIQENNKNKCKYHLDKVGLDDGRIDILIAHIGSIKELEFTYDTEATLLKNEQLEKSPLYENHLGMIGCLANIYHWKPSLVLLSEFGQEMDAIRTKIAEMFSIKSNTDVIATDINFTLDLHNRKIMCFSDRQFHDYANIKTYRSGSQLYYINTANFVSGEELEIEDRLGKDITVF